MGIIVNMQSEKCFYECGNKINSKYPKQIFIPDQLSGNDICDECDDYLCIINKYMWSRLIFLFLSMYIVSLYGNDDIVIAISTLIPMYYIIFSKLYIYQLKEMSCDERKWYKKYGHVLTEINKVYTVILLIFMKFR